MRQIPSYVLSLQHGPHPQGAYDGGWKWGAPSIAASTLVRHEPTRSQSASTPAKPSSNQSWMQLGGPGVWEGGEDVTVFLTITMEDPAGLPCPLPFCPAESGLDPCPPPSCFPTVSLQFLNQFGAKRCPKPFRRVAEAS
jgi:hypothetical protein